MPRKKVAPLPPGEAPEPAAAPAALAVFAQLSVGLLDESPLNNRRAYDPAALNDLVDSIRQHGILNPLLVRSRPEGKYEILAGSRRFRASQTAGLEIVPCRVLDVDDLAALEVVVIDNLQRVDVTPLEEAEGYRALLAAPGGPDVPALAAKVGKSISYVYQRLKLGDLIPELQELLAEGIITPGHAILAARLPASAQQEVLEGGLSYGAYSFDDLRAGGADISSVRNLARWIEEELYRDLDIALFARDECQGCEYREGFRPGLLPVIPAGDRCLRPSCYHAKTAQVPLRAESAAVPEGAAAEICAFHGTLGHQTDSWRNRLLTQQLFDCPGVGVGTYNWRYADHGGDAPKPFERCTFAEVGVLADGSCAGEQVEFCRANECMVHTGGEEVRRAAAAAKRAAQDAEQTKQFNREKEALNTLFLRLSRVNYESFFGDAVRPEVETNVLEEVRCFVTFAVGEMHNDVCVAILKALGREVPKEVHTSPSGNASFTWTTTDARAGVLQWFWEDRSPGHLLCVLRLLQYGGALLGGPFESSESRAQRREPLLREAARQGISFEAVLRELSASPRGRKAARAERLEEQLRQASLEEVLP